MPRKHDAFGDNLELTGYLRKDAFGRLFIDACKTDEEHLTQQAQPGKERPGCRKYLSDIVPEDMLDQRVFINLDIGIVRTTR